MKTKIKFEYEGFCRITPDKNYFIPTIVMGGNKDAFLLMFFCFNLKITW